jgi:hypothetical protein
LSGQLVIGGTRTRWGKDKDKDLDLEKGQGGVLETLFFLLVHGSHAPFYVTNSITEIHQEKRLKSTTEIHPVTDTRGGASETSEGETERKEEKEREE